LIGCDLNNISDETLEILGNTELIAINQDPLGIQARRIKYESSSTFEREVWGGPLANNKYVIIFFNRGSTDTTI
jgi:alpha-galactosidase